MLISFLVCVFIVFCLGCYGRSCEINTIVKKFPNISVQKFRELEDSEEITSWPAIIAGTLVLGGFISVVITIILSTCFVDYSSHKT